MNWTTIIALAAIAAWVFLAVLVSRRARQSYTAPRCEICGMSATQANEARCQCPFNLHYGWKP